MHQRKKGKQDNKNSEDPGRTQRDKEHHQYQVSEKANPHSKSQNKAKPSTRDKESQMFSPNSTKACTKVKKMTRKREQNRALKKMKAYLIITITFENLQKMRSKMPSTSPKKEKQKTAVKRELNSSKFAMMIRRKNQKHLPCNPTKRRLHAEKLAQDPNSSHLQRR